VNSEEVSVKALHFAICAASVLAGVATATAQTTTTQPDTSTTPPAAVSPAAPGNAPAGSVAQLSPRQMPGQWLATDYMSLNVIGPNNERVGDVNNILIDENGRVVAVLVGLGGFLGIGEKTVALPFSAVKVSGPSNQVLINHTKAELESAPSFVTARTANSNSSSDAGKSGTGPKK
jgi:hypothetical protein